MDTKVVAVVSGKGGVGKTTTSAHLGLALARMGQRVVLIDGDIGLRNLDAALGLEGQIIYDVVDVAQALCEAEQALIRYEGETLWLLPASPSKRQMDVPRYRMAQIVASLALRYDWVLVDCPAGVEEGFYNAIAGARTALVVVTPEVSSVRDGRRVLSLLGEAGITDSRLIINRYDAHMARRGTAMSVDEVSELLGVSVLGVVPEDRGAIAAGNRGRPLGDRERAAGAAYHRIARRLLGRRTEIPYGRRTVGSWLVSLWRPAL